MARIKNADDLLNVLQKANESKLDFGEVKAVEYEDGHYGFALSSEDVFKEIEGEVAKLKKKMATKKDDFLRAQVGELAMSNDELYETLAKTYYENQDNSEAEEDGFGSNNMQGDPF